MAIAGQAIYLGDTLIQTLLNNEEVFVNPSTFITNPVSTGRILELNVSSNSYPGEGNTWFDISGNNYNFNQTGSATFSSANGWSLNGNNQYLWSTSSFGTRFTGPITSSMTMFVDYVKTDLTSSGTIFAGWRDQGAQYKMLLEVLDTEKVNFGVANQTGPIGFDTTGTVSGSVREILTYTVSASNQYVYYNDNLMAGTPYPASGLWSTANPPYLVGARLDSSGLPFRYLGGSVKAVIVYNRALSPTERTQVYNYLLTL